MTQRVGVFMSSSEFPPNTEDALLIEAFASLGVQVEPVIWDQWDGASFDHGVIRSTWDYASKYDEFGDWLQLAAQRMRLHNPLATVRWSADKRYLLDLADRDVPVIPQVLVPNPEWDDIVGAARAAGWPAFVAKSVVSAGGREVVYQNSEGLAWPSRSILAPHAPVLVQPYVPEVLTGEYSVICIDGRPSHAVLKLPGAGEFRVQDHYGGTVQQITPPREVLELAIDALAASAMEWTYARADIINTPNGPLLVELELLEPELFLPLAPESSVRLAKAVLA